MIERPCHRGLPHAAMVTTPRLDYNRALGRRVAASDGAQSDPKMSNLERPAITIVIASLVAFQAISTDLYLPSLPAITADFAVRPGDTQLTLSVFLIGFAVCQLVYGPLSDRFGRRPVMIGGVLIYIAASLACMLANSIEMLIAARFLQAVGACSGVVLSRAVVRDIYGRERAAKVLSYVGMAMALAPAIGPILGGYLQILYGWRANFLVLAGFGAVTLVAALIVLPETNRWRDPTATQARRIAANYRSLWANSQYRGYVLICACAYAGIFSFISGSSFLFIDVLGLRPDRYGLCFAAIVVGYMLGTFLSVRSTLKLGLERLVLIGALFGVTGGISAALFSAFGIVTVASIIAPVFVFMIGTGMMMPNATAGAVGPFQNMAGAAAALLGFVQMSLAAGVGIAVGQLHDGSAKNMTFAIAAVALGALFAYVALVRPTLAASAEATPGE